MVIEAAREISGHFNVLHLIFAHRHNIGVVSQNVGRHQHRVGEQAGIRRMFLAFFSLYACTALEQPHRSARH